MNTIYMDAAATSKPKAEVVEAMMPYLFGDKWYNPSSLYSPAVNVKNDIENARKIIANYINADTDEIYFTSGGSESNCWALQGFVNAWFDSRCTPVILTSNIEHKSIISCAKGNEIARIQKSRASCPCKPYPIVGKWRQVPPLLRTLGSPVGGCPFRCRSQRSHPPLPLSLQGRCLQSLPRLHRWRSWRKFCHNDCPHEERQRLLPPCTQCKR